MLCHRKWFLGEIGRREVGEEKWVVFWLSVIEKTTTNTMHSGEEF